MIYFELIYFKNYEEREFPAEFEGMMDKKERKVDCLKHFYNF